MNYLIEISVEQETLWWICVVLYFLLAMLAMRIFANIFKQEILPYYNIETERQIEKENISIGIFFGLIWPITLLTWLLVGIIYLVYLCLKYTVFRGFK